MSSTVGRYAPSPSGRMHLGNLCCCLLAWLSAKSSGGKVVLRIEDLDAVRCPREFADLLEADLAWLGLAADEGGSKGGPRGPYYQSERSAIYEEYYQKLVRKGLVYPCFCSRSQLHAADAPHRSDGKVVYAGTCRNLTPEEIVLRTARRKPAWRVMVITGSGLPLAVLPCPCRINSRFPSLTEAIAPYCLASFIRKLASLSLVWSR